MEKHTKGDKEKHYEYHEYLVDPKQTPIRVDKYLMTKMEKVSRSKIQEAIKAGFVKINYGDAKPNEKIKPYDLITVYFYRPRGNHDTIVPENLPLDIVYEDDDILLVNKAAGMVVHPGIGNWTGTLVNAVAYYLKEQKIPIKKGNTSDRPGLVHRIDKDTSGLLVLAKTEEAMTHLSKQFFDHTIERNYVALVWGDIEEDKGTIEGHIGRHPTMRILRTVYPEGEEGKEATTHFEVIERFYYVTLVKCTLETGRTHQIRVHMKYKGHTLFNDKRYGGDSILKGTVFSKYKGFVMNTFKVMPRHALHANTLGFIHPRTGEKMFFECELPADFQGAIDRWKSYLQSRKNLENG